MFKVIFIDARGPATLGSFPDKGAGRRAWKTCNAGAALVDERGEIVECKSGTTDPAERKLKLYAAHLKRQRSMEPAAPSRGRAPIATVVEDDADEAETDDEEDEDEDAATDTAYTRVERIEQVEAMVARDDERAAARESGASAPALVEVAWQSAPAEPLGPECFGGEDYPSDAAVQPLVPERTVTAPAVSAPPPALRPAEVTHALDPATGATVQGDDTERLTPPAAPLLCDAKGCGHAPGILRKNVLPAWRPFCGACRVVIRQRSRSMPGGVAAVIAHLRAGTLPPPSARHVAIGARGGKSPRRPPPAARRVADPASTLAAGLERVKRHAAVVDALGGVDQAEQLAAVVRDAGGVEVVVEALTELRSVA